MQVKGLLTKLSKELKFLVTCFILTLSIGFYTGISFVRTTTHNTPQGIQERYLGNEEDEEAEVMLFKKPEAEIKTTIHTHILSLSVIFFITGLLVSMTNFPDKFRMFLMIEPFFSLVFTFGGIYFMWLGHLWVKYIVMISGILMTLCYTLSILTILHNLFYSKGDQVKN